MGALPSIHRIRGLRFGEMVSLVGTESGLEPTLTTGTSLQCYESSFLAWPRPLNFKGQRDGFFLSCLSMARSFILVSDCQSGSSPLSLVSNSLGHVPHLKMEVIASRCGP